MNFVNKTRAEIQATKNHAHILFVVVIETGYVPHHDWPQVNPPHPGQFASIVGTLGRARNNPTLEYSSFRANAAAYPLYHTCERPNNTAKKRVTIVEDNNTESSV